MIKAVSARYAYSCHGQLVANINFLDSKRNMIASYNPAGDTETTAVHELKENEEIIGVYGKYNNYWNCFTSFGFIALVKPLI